MRPQLFDFDTAPRSFYRQIDPRAARILRNPSDYTLAASVFVVAGVDAGVAAHPWAIAHRLGCDMAKTAESLVWAFARHGALERAKAKMHEQNEALRREAWKANAPVRDTAAEMLAIVDRVAEVGGQPSHIPIPLENVDLALACGLEVELLEGDE